MVNAGIAGAVERAGAELLADVEAWDASTSGQGSAQLVGSNPTIFIGTTTTPNHGSGTASQVAEWDKDAKDVAVGATNGFIIKAYQAGSTPSLNGNTNRIMPGDGFYGGTGHYRNGDKVLDADDILKYGIGRGPLQNLDGNTFFTAKNYVYTAMSASDLSTWHSSHSTSVIAFFVFAAMRNTGPTTSNLEYYWDSGVDSSETSLSGGNSLISGTLTNPYFQDGTIAATANSGYTPNIIRNGISTGSAFSLQLGGGRGGIVLPSAGDYMQGWVRGNRNWTAPNPDQLISTDKVYWRHDWL